MFGFTHSLGSGFALLEGTSCRQAAPWPTPSRPIRTYDLSGEGRTPVSCHSGVSRTFFCNGYSGVSFWFSCPVSRTGFLNVSWMYRTLLGHCCTLKKVFYHRNPTYGPKIFRKRHNKGHFFSAPMPPLKGVRGKACWPRLIHCPVSLSV